MRKKQRTVRQMRQGTLMIAFVVLVLCVSVSWKKIAWEKQAAENEAQIEALNAQIADEEQRAKELEERKQYMQTKAYVEDMAHEKLGLVYPGEIFIKVGEE